MFAILKWPVMALGILLCGAIAIPLVANDNPDAELLARKIMAGNYDVLKAPSPNMIILRQRGITYRCRLEVLLSDCWQISYLNKDIDAGNL